MKLLLGERDRIVAQQVELRVRLESLDRAIAALAEGVDARVAALPPPPPSTPPESPSTPAEPPPPPRPSLDDPVPTEEESTLNDFVLWVIARTPVFDYGHWANVRWGADTARNRKRLRRCFNYLQNTGRVRRTGYRTWEVPRR